MASFVKLLKTGLNKLGFLKYFLLNQLTFKLINEFLYKNALFFQVIVVFIFFGGILIKNGINNLVFFFKPFEIQISKLL